LRAHASGWGSPRGRVLSRAGIGVLTWVLTPDLVDEAVGDGLAWEMRLRTLPSRLGVYFVLGLCLFSGLPYGQVLRALTGGLEAGLAAAGWHAPATTALTAARRRIGERPLESLFRRVCSALSPGVSPWSHVCGLLAVAWDGTTVAAPDTPANTAAFGKPGAGGPSRADQRQAAAAYPQLRLVTLVACGTRALLDAASGPVRGKGTGEQALARSLLSRLRPGMLLLADRNFYSYQLWNAAAGTGAHLLWRVKAGTHLPVVAELPDGSWLAHVNDPRAVTARARKNGKRRRRGSPLPPDTGPLPGMTVRVIEYVLTVTTDTGRARTERYRLITTLLDHRRYPAADLAAGYAWRWAAETGYREFKTYLRGPGRILRGRTPDLARQELWAYLIIYQAIRAVIALAAAGAGLDPGRISFTAALHAVRRTVPATTAGAALAATETEILSCLVPQRHGRICPRAANKPACPYPSRPSLRLRQPLSQHAQRTVTITPPRTTSHTTTHQPRHPATPPSNPP
jgi:hypothetical protein